MLFSNIRFHVVICNVSFLWKQIGVIRYGFFTVYEGEGVWPVIKFKIVIYMWEIQVQEGVALAILNWFGIKIFLELLMSSLKESIKIYNQCML